MRKGLAPVLLLGLVASGWSVLGSGSASSDPDPTCTNAGVGMAPCNPYLAPTAQAATHGNNYRQSTYLGPTSATGELTAEHLNLDGAVTIWANPSPPYPDGSQVLWLNVAGTDQVMKVAADSLQVLAETAPSTPRSGNGVAYYELNARNQLIRLNASVLEAYGDADPDDPASAIVRVAAFPVPPPHLCQGEDLVGLAHTYDGHLVIGTSLGNLIVMPGDPDDWGGGPSATASINGDRCAQNGDAGLEEMSNNVTVDETGGVYAVSDAALYRFEWDGAQLERSWRSPYRSESAGALGGGSGSTPTLMGDPNQTDRFVVITDASRFMRVNLYWRDDIPDGWVPPVGEDPRLACSVPVDFNEPDRPGTKTDQSVVVDGYASYVVDNTVRDLPGLDEVSSRSRVVFTELAGSQPAHAPRGAARVDWDPREQACGTVWTNPSVSFPTGIPMVARSTHQLINNSLGRVDGTAVFGIRALDADTGRSAWFVPGLEQDCGDRLEPLLALTGVRAPDSPLEPDLSNVCENANFAGVTMDDQGRIYHGTTNGLTRFVAEVDR